MSFIDNLLGLNNDKNFKHLEDLIVESDTVSLDSDISFTRFDKNDFGFDGIKLDVDDLTIDGNGFTIDGKKKTSIFTVLADNVTLKNIHFKHAKSAIVNHGSLNVINCTFEDNIDGDNHSSDINNDGKLVLNNNNFSGDSKTILNTGIIFIEESLKDPLEAISNEGEIYRRKPIEENQQEFEYLRDLITGNDEKITLNHEIIFNVFHEKDNIAIPIQTDNMVIDGYGHTVDLKNKAQGIFYITADNVTIKNLTIKNSPVNAISNEGVNLQIVNCNFENGNSNSHGAVFNKGEMLIINSKFNDNFSQKSGAAISNEGELSIFKSMFLNNHSIESGGAIRNIGQINISYSSFLDNISKKSGSVLSNIGKVKVKECTFTNNSSDDSGSTIADFNGRIDFFDSTFTYNNQPNAVIFTSPESHIEMTGCKMFDNMCGFTTITNHCVLKLKDCEFRSNIAKCVILNTENISHHQIEDKSFLDIENVEFKDNRVDVSVIYNKDKIGKIINSLFKNNITPEGTYTNIHNLGEIILKDLEFGEDKVSILNEGTVVLNESENIEKLINNQGSIHLDSQKN